MEDRPTLEPLNSGPDPAAALPGGAPPDAHVPEYALTGKISTEEPAADDDGDDFVPRIELPPPPSRGEFISTVYRFPFRRDVSWRWCLLAAGTTPAVVLVGGLADPLAFRSPIFSFGLAAMMMGLPLFFVALWTGAYGSALFNCVFESTAGGGDTIEAWPDADWTDWFGELLHLIVVAVVAALPGLLFLEAVRRMPAGAPEPLQAIIDQAAVGAAGIYLFAFPVAWLSSAFSSYRWVPLSSIVARSFCSIRGLTAWLLFFVALLPMPILLWGQLAYAPPKLFTLTLAVFGPQLAAAWLIYARLLGRLAWEISECAAAEVVSADPVADVVE